MIQSLSHRLSRIRWTRTRIALLVGTAIAVIAATATTAASAGTPTIALSKSSDRSNAVALSRVAIKGNVYIFVTNRAQARQVAFYLDDPLRTKAPLNVDSSSPWDLAGTTSDGTANAFDTTKLANGTHKLTARITRGDGSLRTTTVKFSVRNSAPTSTTTSTTLAQTTTTTAAPTTTVAPTTSTTSAPATTTTSVNTGGSSSVPTLGWQINATNTGLARFGLTCASLPAYTGNHKLPSGSNLSGVRFTQFVDLSNGNITIDKSCIRPAELGRGMPIASTTDYNICCRPAPGPVTISNSEFDGSLGSLEEQAYAVGFHGIASLYNNYFHDLGGGFAIYNAGSQFSSVVQGNYVNRMKSWGNPATTGNHVDSFTVRDFDISKNPSRTIAVRGNRFDCDAPTSCTGAFFIQANGSIGNLTVQDNLLEGDGYQLVLEGNAGGYTNVRAINNRFSGEGYGAGYVDYTKGSGWTEQRDNYINEPSKIDNKGRLVTF